VLAMAALGGLMLVAARLTSIVLAAS
jgi:hypothetical protein